MSASLRPRQGTVLIVVAGISALLMSVAVAYLINMRSDLEETALLQRETQARLVLIAGLQYIQEASRLGWDKKDTTIHEEGFGWADIRDGSAGPKDVDGKLLYTPDPLTPRFPEIGGKAARFPLYVMERPPFALAMNFTYNPAPMDGTLGWDRLVNYTKPDPLPAKTTWREFAEGNTAARRNSLGMSWMRIYREKNVRGRPPVEPATFIITCGAGATEGFRTYQDAYDEGKSGLFNHDPAFFALLRSQESVLWFRTQWTSAVGGSSMGIRMQNGLVELPELNKESYFKAGTTGYDIYEGTAAANREHHWWVNRNPLGSFLYIERLQDEPTEW